MASVSPAMEIAMWRRKGQHQQQLVLYTLDIELFLFVMFSKFLDYARFDGRTIPVRVKTVTYLFSVLITFVFTLFHFLRTLCILLG
jgi:hypothetical protein